MAAIDETKVVGRGGVNFADERDIDEFVNLLGKFERGEMAPDDWRRYRLTRGTYGQRQDGVQMLRIKAPQGIVSSGQMRAFAEVATKYSRGFGHVTTRQNIQLHFVLLKDCEDAMRILGDEGLTTREACGNAVRNVTGCPYMGTSSSEIFDVYPYAEALTRYFLRHPLAAVLPRKFKIAFEGCTEDHALASINDIGWRARIQDGQRGFRVTIAGGTSIMPVSGYVLYEFLPVAEMQNVAEAVLRVFHKYGDYEHRQRNRMKFVVKQLGWETFRARVMEELEAFVATGGAPLRLTAEQLAPQPAPDWQPSQAPSVNAVAAAAVTPVMGPGIMPGSVKLQTVQDPFVRWGETNVAPQKQGGYHHVTVRLPLGDMTAGQMRVLADLSESYGDGTMRLTVEQNVLFKWVKKDALQPFYDRIAAAGLGAPDANTLGDVVSCPGAESCRLAVTQSRGLGRGLTEYLSTRSDLVNMVPSGKGSIKISGCPNGCGQHHIASIGFQGSVRKVGGKAIPQYFVLAGGGCADDGTAYFGKVVSKVPVHRMNEVIERLVKMYDAQHLPDEDLGAFFRRVPTSQATEALKDLALLLPNEITEQDYVDLGETQAFNPEVMDGECAV
jgi:sulfite reductase (NADPH) hemoprotein beta-component